MAHPKAIKASVRRQISIAVRNRSVAELIASESVQNAFADSDSPVTIPIASTEVVSDYEEDNNDEFLQSQLRDIPTAPKLEASLRKRFSFSVSNNVNIADPKFVRMSREMWSGLSDHIDKLLLNEAVGNSGETAGDLLLYEGTSNMRHFLKTVNRYLDSAYVPDNGGRFVVLPCSAIEPAEDLASEPGPDANPHYIGDWQGITICTASTDSFPTRNGNPIGHFGYSPMHVFGYNTLNLEVLEVPQLPGAHLVQGIVVGGSQIVEPKAFGTVEIR